MLSRRVPLLPALGLLLALGFAGSAVISYLAARATINVQITDTTLPLTAETIDAELESQLFQKVAITRAMAANTFLTHWLENGERNPASLITYLSSIRAAVKATTAFFVSEATGRYYHPDGVLKQVSRQDPRDRWYFNFLERPAPFEINIDRDTADPDRVTAFINQKLRDRQGRILGAIGIGVEVHALSKLLRHIEQRYNSEVLFTDADGHILLASWGNAISGRLSLADLPGMAPWSTRILSRSSDAFDYRIGSNQIFVNSRRIPELNWWLVVRQRSGPDEGGLLSTLISNLLIAALITLIVLWLANMSIGDYQRRLELMATTDGLTGQLNRTSFENLFASVVRAAWRRGESLAALLIDIDHFKTINDSWGHLVGDQALRHVAEKLAASIRASDLLFRWGGEEFLLLLPGCDDEAGKRLAQDLQAALRCQPLLAGGSLIAITISIGITLLRPGDGPEELLARADQALYQAKASGRDRVEVA
jgi:diguanylate cyclase (GGDEF)-like protein